MYYRLCFLGNSNTLLAEFIFFAINDADARRKAETREKDYVPPKGEKIKRKTLDCGTNHICSKSEFHASRSVKF